MKSLFLFICCLLSFFACKKREDPNGSSSAPNGWTLNGKQYLFDTPLKTIQSYIAYDAEGKYISFSFSNFPTKNGSYSIIGPQNPPAAGEVNVYVFDSLGVEKAYFSTGTEGKSAQISLVGDQLQVVLPEIWAKNVLNTDSVKVTAHLRPL